LVLPSSDHVHKPMTVQVTEIHMAPIVKIKVGQLPYHCVLLTQLPGQFVHCIQNSWPLLEYTRPDPLGCCSCGFWATVCKTVQTVRPMLLDHCLSVCLSVCPVLSVCDVGVMWPNSWMDQGETWHARRPRPWPHCVRWGPSSPSPNGHHSPSTNFLFSPIFCFGQMAGWIKMPLGMEVGLIPGDCVRWGPSSPPLKGGGAPAQFSAHFYCGQMAAWIKMPLVMEVGLSPDNIVLDGDRAAPPPQKKGTAPQFSTNVFFCGQTAVCIRIPLGTEVGLRRGNIVFDGDPAPLP